MKFTDSGRIKEMLINYYNNSRIPVWIYGKDLNLSFTNFTNPVLLHLMDSITPIAEQFREEASYANYMKLFGTMHEAYLSFYYTADRKHTFIITVGPVLLSYPTDDVWEQLSFHKSIWAEKKDAGLTLLPVLTLEAFLSNTRFIMQIFGVYTLNPLQLADSLPLTNYYNEEKGRFDYLTGEIKSEFYSVKQSHEVEEQVLYNIRKGYAEKVDEILIQRDRISLLLPAEYHKDNFIYGIGLLSGAKNAAIAGGMRSEAAFAMFRSYSIQLQSCHQSIEFYRLIHHALCAFAEGVQSVSVHIMDNYSDTIKNCIQAIHSHMPGRISVEELAEEVHLTPKYLSALFAKETGSSLSLFITNLRIDEAKQLLAISDLSYLEISNVLDFCSQSHFTTTFKKITGITPREYRLQNSKNNTTLSTQDD